MRRGVTLIETLLYVALVAVIMGAGVSYTFTIYRQKLKNEAVIEGEQAARLALDLISAKIRSAKEVVYPAAGVTGVSLTLEMPSGTPSPVDVRTIGGQVQMRETASGSWVPLTPQTVQVTSLAFRNVQDPVTHVNTWTIVFCPIWELKLHICHLPNTLRENRCIFIIDAILHLFHGDFLGTCDPPNSARGSVRMTMTVTTGAGLGNEYQSSITVYATATTRKQN